MIKSILIAANNFPTPTDSVSPFVEQLVLAMARKGVKITVIAPFRIVQHFLRHTELHPKKRHIYVEGGEPITVYQPRYITLGNKFESYNLKSASKAVKKVATKLKEKPDVCYGYFWHWGYTLFDYAQTNGIPLIVHNGETPIMLHEICTYEKLIPFVEYVSGVVCNSRYCKQISVEAELTLEKNCCIFPNAIDGSLFYQHEKEKLRKEHNISDNDFVIAFTGWFNENKGSLRISEAIDRLNDPNIKSVFIGENQGGNFEPKCKGIIHKGRVPHSEIPKLLSMADVFVLPTQHEGSSNAIIEAMACGLPIISSNRSFNWDVLNETNSIMIDPMSVDEIAAAINTLKEDKQKRVAMSKAALETAAELTIEKRAEKILKFIESKI